MVTGRFDDEPMCSQSIRELEIIFKNHVLGDYLIPVVSVKL